MAQTVGETGSGNQSFPQCFAHALGDMDHARITGRPDGSIRLRVTNNP